MRIALPTLSLAGILLSAAPSAVSAQAAPPPQFSALTTSRVLLLPAQEVAGIAGGTAWMARFDSLLTDRIENGGVGAQWAYPRDAVHYSRMNPTYVSDPHLMGTQPLKNVQVTKDGFALPQPFASRLRALIAIANARTAIVPVAVRVDTTKSPATAQLQLMIVDGRASSVQWSGMINVRFAGGPAAAADSLAIAVAKLFIRD